MKKILLGTVAIVAAGILAAACDGGGDKTYTLSSGNYLVDGEDIPADSCWPDSTAIHNLLTTTNLPIAITATSETSFIVSGRDLTAGFIASVPGTKDGNALLAAGTDVAVITTACSLQYGFDLDGTMTATDEAEVVLSVSLTVNGVMNSAGTAASDCSALAGQQIGGVLPVPVAVSSNQNCAITISGAVYPE